MNITQISDFANQRHYIFPVIVLGISGVIVGITWLIYKLTHKSKPETTVPAVKDVNPAMASVPAIPSEPDKDINCMVFDGGNRTFNIETMKLSALQKCKEENKETGIGRQWNFEGKEVYALFRNREKNIAPVIPSDTMEQSPSKLFEALDQPYINIIWDMKKEMSGLEKYGWFMAIGGASLFAMIIAVVKK